MWNKTAIAIAFVAGMVLTGIASAETRVVYVGGHDPARTIRVVNVPAEAPNAFSGNQAATTRRIEPIRVDSRIVGYRVVDK
jgi:hypothetical protein